MRWPLAAVVLVASGLVGNCGGDGMRKEDFLAQAEERCRNVLSSFPRDQAEEGGPGPGSAELNRRRAESYRRFSADLQALEAPEEMRADFSQFIEKTDRQAANRDEYAAAIEAGDPRQLRFLDDEFRAINQTKRDLRSRLGFKSC